MTENPQLKNFEQLSGAVRYYRWFAEIVSPWVGRRILDIGCGHGNVTVNFLDRTYVHGIDIEPSYLEHIQKRFAANKNFRADSGDIMDPLTTQRLAKDRLDTVIAFNVLEHIADDPEAVKNIFTILEPGGHFVMLVPAFEWLMSPYDHAVGHHRRYTKKSARALLASAGFSVVHAQYFNALGALGWLWTYTILKKDEPGEGAVKILEFLVPMLKRIERALSVPFGISVICVGKKL
ncbi:MAG: class I SAM-dependent methyltransferase [bacterium]|nr:class I SAM-dependent methyltransferase [bacterium]